MCPKLYENQVGPSKIAIGFVVSTVLAKSWIIHSETALDGELIKIRFTTKDVISQLCKHNNNNNFL